MVICCSCKQPKQFAYVHVLDVSLCIECLKQIEVVIKIVQSDEFFNIIRTHNEAIEAQRLEKNKNM